MNKDPNSGGFKTFLEHASRDSLIQFTRKKRTVSRGEVTTKSIYSNKTLLGSKNKQIQIQYSQNNEGVTWPKMAQKSYSQSRHLKRQATRSIQQGAFPVSYKIFSPSQKMQRVPSSSKGQWGRDPIDTFEMRAQTSTNYSTGPKPLTALSGQYSLRQPGTFRSNVFVMDAGSNCMSPATPLIDDELQLSEAFCPTNILSSLKSDDRQSNKEAQKPVQAFSIDKENSNANSNRPQGENRIGLKTELRKQHDIQTQVQSTTIAQKQPRLFSAQVRSSQFIVDRERAPDKENSFLEQREVTQKSHGELNDLSVSAIQQVSEDDERQTTVTHNDIFLQSLIARRPRPQTSKARPKQKQSLNTQKSSKSIANNQLQGLSTLQSFRMTASRKRENGNASPTQKYSTYSALNDVGSNNVPRNYLCTSNTVYANIHSTRTESNHSPLNPSIEQSQQHNLARQFLKGIPSYLDQIDVRKLIQDKKKQLKTHASKACEAQNTLFDPVPTIQDLYSNQGQRKQSASKKQRLRSAQQRIRSISREYIESATIQADLMRNKPKVPSSRGPLGLSSRLRLSPQMDRRVRNDSRTNKAAAAIMVAKADVLSVLKQKTEENKPALMTSNGVTAEGSRHETSIGERPLISSRRGSNPFKDKRLSVKFKLDQEEKEYENVSQILDHAQVLVKAAHSEMFDHKYEDYREKVDEVNKAKSFLLANRDKISEDTKRRMIKHIKRKMMIIEMIEEEFGDMRQHSD